MPQEKITIVKSGLESQDGRREKYYIKHGLFVVSEFYLDKSLSSEMSEFIKQKGGENNGNSKEE